MTCNELLRIMDAYLDEELSETDQRTAGDHVRSCADCAEEVRQAVGVRQALRAGLQRRAAGVSAPPGAWGRLQAKMNPSRRRSMEMRRALALAPLAVLAIVSGAAAAVPSVRAQAGEHLAILFSLRGPDVVYQPAYVPDAVGNNMFVGINVQPDRSSAETTYEGPKHFLIVSQEKVGSDRSLPRGEAISVGGQAAVLETGLSGTRTVRKPVAMEPRGPGNATPVHAEVTVVRIEPNPDGSGRVRVERAGEPASAEVTISPAAVPAVPVEMKTEAAAYRDAARITWYIGDHRVTVFGDLPRAELLKVAESVRPSEAGARTGASPKAADGG